ncbi:HNH endonuclease signature motif containing protein [Propionibacterium acidifaciens]|uniref:HNH endonuclease n=1 Tax=Propionibacterium acidifaciens TaxID=556499 RepID=UPI0028DC87F1|nr:HNH endonuclease signature motif containing protein [Propionibacterium acidifaciens]
MAKRSTTLRDKHRTTIARNQPPCAICGQPIDYTLPHDNPMAYVVDHIIPIAAGGPDTIDNKQPAHRDCNRQKGDTIGGLSTKQASRMPLVRDKTFN